MRAGCAGAVGDSGGVVAAGLGCVVGSAAGAVVAAAGCVGRAVGRGFVVGSAVGGMGDGATVAALRLHALSADVSSTSIRARMRARFMVFVRSLAMMYGRTLVESSTPAARCE